MDRSLKKATENLLEMKRKFRYRALQIRYQDMTKVVPIFAFQNRALCRKRWRRRFGQRATISLCR